jgi:hypothetical protein
MRSVHLAATSGDLPNTLRPLAQRFQGVAVRIQRLSNVDIVLYVYELGGGYDETGVRDSRL